MKVSEIVSWGRSLSNIASAKAIEPDYEDQSVNASWKDLYSTITESDTDYFTATLLITVTAGMATGTFEYMVPLPENFYKLRAIDYIPSFSNGLWAPMEKFALSSRTDEWFTPRYRLDNSNLWIVGQNVSQIRVKYYLPPAALTHPQPDLQFDTAVTPNNFALISSPVYAAWKNTGAYVYNAQNIVEGSIDDGTVGAPVILGAIAANLSYLTYYKGYLYWLQAGKITRAPTDLKTAPLVPAIVVASGTVTALAVYKDKLYYTDAGSVYNANLDGTGVSAAMAVAAATSLALAGGNLYIVVGTNLSMIGGPPLMMAGTTYVTSDGTNLYTLDNINQVHVLTVQGAAIGTNTVIRSDVKSMGPWSGSRLPVLLQEAQQYLAIDTTIDTNLTYPLNAVFEIMAYQAAVDFKTKLAQDFAGLMVRLGHPSGPDGPASGFWARFEKTIRRDEYKPEKANNSRRSMGNW
jgi:hypothetical protein